MQRRFLSLVFVVVGLGSYACSSSDGGGGNTTNTCKEYSPPAGTDLNNPQVSFKTDVYPIFTGSCGLSTSCHGSKSTSQASLYLGSRTDTDTSAVRNGVVGKRAEALDMSVIAAGDPKNSYLMHKMDGDQCTLTCKGGSCQRAMPDGSDPLAEDKRLVIRRWISQGAKDN